MFKVPTLNPFNLLI